MTGEIHYVDAGYNIVAMPRLDTLKSQDEKADARRRRIVSPCRGKSAAKARRNKGNLYRKRAFLIGA